MEQADGDRATVVSSLTGVALDEKATARHLTAAALVPKGQRRVARLGLMVVHPHFTTKQARALHITSTIAVFTTDMGFSSSNRIHNVHLMADILQDHVIQPGTSFSFNQVVGPRTAERGFLEGQAIENGLLVPSIGGGVCQVATTIYNAAFHAGLPIDQRTNHSFYISHYPLGMDATVADGGPDFVFTNDTSHPIIIKTTLHRPDPDRGPPVGAAEPAGRAHDLGSDALHRPEDPLHPRRHRRGRPDRPADDRRAGLRRVGRRGRSTRATARCSRRRTSPRTTRPRTSSTGWATGALPPGSKPDKTKTGTTGNGTGTTGTGTGTGATGTGTGSTDTTSTDTSPTSTAPTGNSATASPRRSAGPWLRRRPCSDALTKSASASRNRHVVV